MEKAEGSVWEGPETRLGRRKGSQEGLPGLNRAPVWRTEVGKEIRADGNHCSQHRKRRAPLPKEASETCALQSKTAQNSGGGDQHTFIN